MNLHTVALLLLAVTAFSVVEATVVEAAVDDLLFPKLTCFSRTSDTTITMFLGVDNFNLEPVVNPSVNSFFPNSVEPPTTFPAGFTPRVLSLSVTVGDLVSWTLGSNDHTLTIQTGDLSDTALCSAGEPGPPGPSGPPGPQGPPGPPGPPGNANIFPSALVYTFPGGGQLTISDPHVNPTSVILLQYVDGRGDPKVVDVGAGQFTALGSTGRRFRYVIFN